MSSWKCTHLSCIHVSNWGVYILDGDKPTHFRFEKEHPEWWLHVRWGLIISVQFLNDWIGCLAYQLFVGDIFLLRCPLLTDGSLIFCVDGGRLCFTQLTTFGCYYVNLVSSLLSSFSLFLLIAVRVQPFCIWLDRQRPCQTAGRTARHVRWKHGLDSHESSVV